MKKNMDDYLDNIPPSLNMDFHTSDSKMSKIFNTLEEANNLAK